MVKQAVQEPGGLDVLMNSVATQQPVSDFTELGTRQLERTFRVNIFSDFWTSQAAIRTCLTEALLPHVLNGLRGNKTGSRSTGNRLVPAQEGKAE